MGATDNRRGDSDLLSALTARKFEVDSRIVPAVRSAAILQYSVKYCLTQS
jgi:hypothetical protein